MASIERYDFAVLEDFIAHLDGPYVEFEPRGTMQDEIVFDRFAVEKTPDRFAAAFV
jgi:hypothetical protein